MSVSASSKQQAPTNYSTSHKSTHSMSDEPQGPEAEGQILLFGRLVHKPGFPPDTLHYASLEYARHIRAHGASRFALVKRVADYVPSAVFAEPGNGAAISILMLVALTPKIMHSHSKTASGSKRS